MKPLPVPLERACQPWLFATALAAADFGQIAICDVRLPGGESGVDLAVRLRALGKKAILLSGETDSALKRNARRHGLRLLIKPISSEGLLAALRELSLGG
jgi:DNA-binding response OmpR family regulator